MGLYDLPTIQYYSLILLFVLHLGEILIDTWVQLIMIGKLLANALEVMALYVEPCSFTMLTLKGAQNGPFAKQRSYFVWYSKWGHGPSIFISLLNVRLWVPLVIIYRLANKCSTPLDLIWLIGLKKHGFDQDGILKMEENEWFEFPLAHWLCPWRLKLRAVMRVRARTILFVMAAHSTFATMESRIISRLNQTPLHAHMHCLMLCIWLGILRSHCYGDFSNLSNTNCIVNMFDKCNCLK